ncbi:glutamate-cysteine ligase family protein [Alteromonas sp. ASW11-36]|uniref:Glutamate-cysteine ligase family protein n=1 Tax=Alteromonas arenosi TaxID=3055817 RepID=A0ABT7SWD5_9ALTE|nr:glutamate-cysteine ligase family protein [Alteromonas sp. ASW11-36]MDM7860484.1 glutamate-cysteine ligase family protein [Alteromonas sp. ASW11-36]
MGHSIHQQAFTADQYARFNQRLEDELCLLPEYLTNPALDREVSSIGAELELYLVDAEWLPTPKNQWLLDQRNNPLLQPELNRYNLEFNLAPVASAGKSLSALQQQLDQEVALLRSLMMSKNARVVPIGILPTLTEYHLDSEFLTDRPRYHVLAEQLAAMREGAFEVDINGQDHLQMRSNEVTLEGANTSFQVHLRVPQSRFVDIFNAAQLVTPLVLALAANSPIFMGKRLWHETRIALFKQSIDSRNHLDTPWRQPARVNFGQGWLRNSVYELFAENVALYPPLLPQMPDCDELSKCKALQLHQGTIWAWNRPVLDTGNDPHLRIEFRTLPAGPTNIDMIANTAVLIGLTLALSETVNQTIAKLPFQYAEFNFYRCAQAGLNAKVLWPQQHQHQLTERRVIDVIADVLPLAADGLRSIGVDQQDIDRYLTVVERRLAAQQTGASWQLSMLERVDDSLSPIAKLAALVEQYTLNNITGYPVADWD